MINFSYHENEDKELVAFVKEGLKENDGYCPCLVEKSKDTKCICIYFRDLGVCHCQLYIKDMI